MKDFVIDAAIWHVQGDPLGKQILIDDEIAYAPLINFLHAHKLVKREKFGRDLNSWIDFELRVSDLTEEGYELVRRCHNKWAKSLDRIKIGEITAEKALKRISVWEKELEEIRAKSKF